MVCSETILLDIESTIRFSLVLLEDLKDRLENYIKRWNGLVKLYRTGKRVGLIAARTLGAQKATGDAFVVLDAHCECVRSKLEYSSRNIRSLLDCQLASAIINAYCNQSKSISCADRRWH